MTAPNQEAMINELDAKSGYHNIDTAKNGLGTYKMCFYDYKGADHDFRVYFSFYALREERPVGTEKVDDKMQNSLKSIHRSFYEIENTQRHHSISKRKHRNLIEDNFSKTWILTLYSTILMIFVSVLNVLTLKSFFNPNGLIISFSDRFERIFKSTS
uniref:GOLD domain-containing protein n=1 Tax=Rhabditophanes sp. KR3021 TaxID=114890 RepID=A0AC35UI98_9BILA